MTKNVTVIGLGAMGSAMAARFLDEGHSVTVWNRTAAKAGPLVARGAAGAATAAEAVAASDLVVFSQLDYQAMYDSLGSADLTGKVLVNLSSDTPATLREAAGWVRERGGELVAGGIMVPPPGIGTPAAYAFYSGPEEPLQAHAGTLRALGEVRYVGADHGLAMAYYQALLLVFWTTLTSFMYGAALVGGAERLRPYAIEMLAAMADDGPMGFVTELAGELEKGVYPGELNNLRMQAVGMEHVVEAVRQAGLDASFPAALKDLFRRAVEAGHGAEGLGSVSEVIRTR
ncbi:NAD(P)-dependent oxidoreductase [Thermoactinospora rubra]|uniref:NAD(P)-dependent oxidoreductase n=1 Tax=Thermoactinospora rubra TaxID=1088767 RepID=UPI000A113571|nr:NAD(P)-binding domain-containing protein [Thermoactinospora rubra]